MDSINKINFKLKEVRENEILEIDGISFSNIAYTLVFVDEVDLFTIFYFQDSFLVFKELKKSISQSGNYLLFTGISGIADDAGWDYIEVIHDKNLITWNIQRNYTLLTFRFEKCNYIKAVFEIEKVIENLNAKLSLEPLYVIYPD